MRTALLLVGLLIAGAVQAQVYVEPYTRDDGTRVDGHYRSEPDSSYNNNWSVEGNQNPFTGEMGDKSPTINDRTPNSNEKTFGEPLTID